MQRAIPARSPWILVPPPPFFVACFFAGVMIDRALGWHLPGALVPSARVLGAFIAVVGALFPLSAVTMFAVRRTTIIPHGSARALCTSGPYRITRNPMYVGLTLLYVGLALFLDYVAPLAFLALPLWALETKTIPFEEAMLERIFGDTYAAYERRVRRWL